MWTAGVSAARPASVPVFDGSTVVASESVQVFDGSTVVDLCADFRQSVRFQPESQKFCADFFQIRLRLEPPGVQNWLVSTLACQHGTSRGVWTPPPACILGITYVELV